MKYCLNPVNLNMEKKSPKTAPAPQENSTMMEKAGEILSNIGSHLADAKEAVTQTVVKEYKVVKKAIKKKLAKKKSSPKKAVKKAVKKAAPKTAKKAATSSSAPTKRLRHPAASAFSRRWDARS